MEPPRVTRLPRRFSASEFAARGERIPMVHGSFSSIAPAALATAPRGA